jgi:hypothetical protein
MKLNLYSTLRSLLTLTGPGLALAMLAPALSAQTLFVSDLDIDVQPFRAQDSTFRADLTAAGVTYTTISVTNGTNPPALAELNSYQRVIWFCGTDGTDLGFWNAEDDIRQYALTGKKLWIIGQDLLYALHGAPPVNFNNGDIELDIMGISGYLVQSFGNDGGEGCPQMDVDPGVSGSFASPLTWIFTTLWWADGVNTGENTIPIYSMGPLSYALAEIPSMVYKRVPGSLKVMSTLFNPTAIATLPGRIQFIQQTLNYMDLNTGLGELANERFRLSSNPATGLVALEGQSLQGIEVLDLRGALVHTANANGANRHVISLDGWQSGLYMVSAISANGQRSSTRLLVE